MMRKGTLAAIGIGLAALVAVAGVGHAQAPAPAAEATPPPQVVPKLTESASPPPPPAFKRAPRLVKSTPPEYPAAERRAGTEGEVIVALLVQKDGTPAQIEVRHSSGSAALDAAAIASAQTWRYEPAIGLDDQPMELRVQQRLKFKLEGEAFDNPMTKRCSAITAEVAAYQQANPGEPARRAPVFATTAGLLLVASVDRPAKDLAQWYRTLPAVFDEVLRQCAAKPEATMQDVLPGALEVGRTATPPPG